MLLERKHSGNRVSPLAAAGEGRVARRGMENGAGPQGQGRRYALEVLGSPWALLIPAHLAGAPSVPAVSRAEYADPLSQRCRLLSVVCQDRLGPGPGEEEDVQRGEVKVLNPGGFRAEGEKRQPGAARQSPSCADRVVRAQATAESPRALLLQSRHRTRVPTPFISPASPVGGASVHSCSPDPAGDTPSVNLPNFPYGGQAVLGAFLLGDGLSLSPGGQLLS